MSTTVDSTILTTHNSSKTPIILDTARKARNFRDNNDNLKINKRMKLGFKKIRERKYVYLHLEVLVVLASMYDSVYECFGNHVGHDMAFLSRRNTE